MNPILYGAVGVIIAVVLMIVNNTKPIPEKYKLKSDDDLDLKNKSE
jgi:hypothetical protein